ncbi:TIR domain-containing protein [Histomonas meleagridis]|uniref:TIR domain-containing protein n=1 Tax=Histomonas meleagridis TaxID=135588 RepID=UPI00355A4B43|nr:TIR domain-containing protein [Histomonas meleagridis]KAH0802112.1 TIR domain-containing protein [Histomonas meleagridis]
MEKGTENKLTTEAIDRYSMFLAAGYEDGTIVMNLLSDGNIIKSTYLFGHKSPISGLEFSTSDGTIRLASSSYNSVIVWVLTKGKWKYQKELEFDEECTSISFSPDGGRVAISFRNGKIEIREAFNDFDIVKVINANADEVSCVSFVPGESDILCATSNGSLMKHNLDGKLIMEKQIKALPIIWAQPSGDGSIAAVCDDSTIIVFDPNEQMFEIPFSKKSKPLKCGWNNITNSLLIIDDKGLKSIFMQFPNGSWKCI